MWLNASAWMLFPIPPSSFSRAPACLALLQGENGERRKVRANEAVGFVSSRNSSAQPFDPSRSVGSAKPLEKAEDSSEEAALRVLEEKVHRLLEESADAIAAKDFQVVRACVSVRACVCFCACVRVFLCGFVRTYIPYVRVYLCVSLYFSLHPCFCTCAVESATLSHLMTQIHVHPFPLASCNIAGP